MTGSYPDASTGGKGDNHGSTSWSAEGYGPSTAHMYEGNLNGSFADHNRQGEWATTGRQEPCWELPHMESTSTGDMRHIDGTTSPAWESTTIVHTGLTRGDNGSPSTPMYDSELPNH